MYTSTLQIKEQPLGELNEGAAALGDVLKKSPVSRVCDGRNAGAKPKNPIPGLDVNFIGHYKFPGEQQSNE